MLKVLNTPKNTMRTLGAIWLNIYIYIYIFESKGASWAIGKYIRLGDIGKAKIFLSLGQLRTLKNTLKRVGMLGWSSRVVEGAKNVNVFN